MTPAEYSTLLSRFADFKHNKDKYPITRFGEAVIHSTQCPNVIMYVKGNIGDPQITKIVKIDSSIPNTIQSDIQKEIISNERNGLSLPWENVKSIFGEETIDIYKRRDFQSFQESERRGKRELSEKDSTHIRNKHDRAGDAGESEEAYSRNDGVKRSPEKDREEKFYSELMRGLLSANGTEDAQLPTREAENADTGNESVISETSQKATDEDLIKSLMSGLGVKKIHKEKPIQLHHYATNKNRYFTKLFKKITDRYGLDLDGDWNKDLLQHQGRHPNDYHNFILKELKKINIIANGNKDIFLHLFENRVKKIIRNNQDMLYSKYWKNLKEK